jgi:hypothetical protein
VCGDNERQNFPVGEEEWHNFGPDNHHGIIGVMTNLMTPLASAE